MYIFAYLLLVAAFLCAIFFAGVAAIQLWNKQNSALVWVERSSFLITALMTFSSFVLLSALINHDFSVEYVARYSDRLLPLFYRITAFWAGQAGSMLFWGWSVAIFGVLFLVSKTYERLTKQTKLWFWLFFLATIALFLLIITGWSNPFIVLSTPPADGNGMNPLLQHPGMIFHPPLLFLGYGGFVIPGCMALAQTLSMQRENEGQWAEVVRPFTMIAWILLSAGIILGAWWAYMELGWGGYWAWDPVENASLLPWLIATAFLHTSVVESRRGKLLRFNVFLMALTTISAFFATYIVRSGAIESLHAYPDGGVGGVLLFFIIIASLVSLLVAFGGSFKSKELGHPFSREGMMLIVSWLLLAIAAIILVATMWPVLSQLWSNISQTKGPDFYNKVCLPLFMLLGILLIFCPWLSWSGGFKRPRLAMALAGIFAISIPVFWFLMEAPFAGSLSEKISALAAKGPAQIVAQLTAAAAITSFISIALLFFFKPGLLKSKITVAAHGVHVGVLLMFIGIAFSGPFQQEKTSIMSMGQTNYIDGYAFKLDLLERGEASSYAFYEATITLYDRAGTAMGTVHPERRMYYKYPQGFTEASTIFSMGNEIYASLLSVSEKDATAQIRVTLNPLVNWLWLGGIILCICPFIGMLENRRRDTEV